jgi:hypothetical protein
VAGAHLFGVLKAYAEYYTNDRANLAPGKDAPHSRPIEAEGRITSEPVLGGLHHRYRRAPPERGFRKGQGTGEE